MLCSFSKNFEFYKFKGGDNLSRSPACFDLGWPMKKESKFLAKPTKGKRVSFNGHFQLHFSIDIRVHTFSLN